VKPGRNRSYGGTATGFSHGRGDEVIPPCGQTIWPLSADVSRRVGGDRLDATYVDGKTPREIAADRVTSERAVEGRLRL
jgi:hypothetical protein